MPAEEMLKHLRTRCATLRRLISDCEKALVAFGKAKAGYETSIELTTRRKSECQSELSALEQAIKGYEVLLQPEFRQVRLVCYGNGADEWITFWDSQTQRRTLFEVGATAVESLLKAHDVLYPPSPSVEKGE